MQITLYSYHLDLKFQNKNHLKLEFEIIQQSTHQQYQAVFGAMLY